MCGDYNVSFKGVGYGASEVGIYCSPIGINNPTGTRIHSGMNAELVNWKGDPCILQGIIFWRQGWEMGV